MRNTNRVCYNCPNADSDGLWLWCRVKSKGVTDEETCPDYGKAFEKAEKDHSHYYGGGNFGRKKDKDYKNYWKGLDK